MDIQNILTADILDILFEGKNKSYGAYELRKTYNKRLAIALSATLACCTLLFAGYLLANTFPSNEAMTFTGPDIILDAAPEKKPEKVIIPDVKKPTATPVRTVIYSTPIIVKEATASEIPPMDEIANAKIGFKKNDGAEFDGITGPVSDGVAKGIFSIPEKPKDNPDSIFMKVEVESEYPGGASAWARFLNKKLANNYPEQAVENGIQGRVMIQFIVDRDGNVSDVRAVDGPPALQEAAVKVIKQSGQWIPAVQNGMKVKSYKKQPITFQLSTD